MKDPDKIRHVDEAIRNRKTLKVLSSRPKKFNLARAVVEQLLEAASWAPFHRPAALNHRRSGMMDGIVPWRFHVLDGTACRTLRQTLLDQGDTTKIPRMLATATNLIQATWLPNPKASGDEEVPFDPTLENMEHIAAAAAAVQNLLVAATAREIQTYWSSGGSLRNPDTMNLLGIPDGEILLGSLFLFGPLTDNVETSPGKLRDLRGPVESWARWVEPG